MYKKIILFCLTMCLINMSYAQQENNEAVETGKTHQVALVVGLTHIPAAFEDGHSKSSVLAPTIGIDYLMHLSNNWKIGAVLDLEFAKYVVDYNQEELEREKALVTGILVGYEFESHWSLLLGPGVEFEKNKNIFILRTCIDYEFELENGWGLFPSFNYDFKNEYSTYSLCIGVCKKL